MVRMYEHGTRATRFYLADLKKYEAARLLTRSPKKRMNTSRVMGGIITDARRYIAQRFFSTSVSKCACKRRLVLSTLRARRLSSFRSGTHPLARHGQSIYAALNTTVVLYRSTTRTSLKRASANLDREALSPLHHGGLCCVLFCFALFGFALRCFR